ncbi:MAG: DUF2975 domain-containing protein [Clostridia bacterium]|nr:DUF2975 domain-containing protein [Clostridia bacterium]
MKEIAMKRRILLSQVLTVVLLAGLTALAVCIPWIMRGYITNFAYANSAAAEAAFGMIVALCYCVLIPAYAAAGLMLKLLSRVRSGQIFSSPSSKIIQLIAICCFAECAIFGLFTFYFAVSLGIAFCALFLGIALLVVADVISVGTEIKTENDFTV